MTTQPESGTPQPESGTAQSESGQPDSPITQSPYGESKEKSSSSLSTRWSWPRDLSDLWTGWQPFGGMNWPFRDIKVEEFVDGDQLVVRAEVPGVDPERDIDVSVENDVLTISAERRESSREKMGDRGFHSEFRYGSFVRQVRLPAGTSPEVVSATYRDGVLEIRMPKPSGEGVSRRIQIQRG
jgi:HSP20 family protein